MGLGDEFDDLGEQGGGADAGGLQIEAAATVDRAGADFAVGTGFDGERFAGEHGFIDRALSGNDDAIDGNFSAGADAEDVADLHFVERDFAEGVVILQLPRGGRGEVHERVEGAAGALPGSQFHDLSGEDEGDDDGGGFEVEVAGADGLRGEEHDEAEGPRGEGAHGDESEHVGRTVSHRGDGAAEERPAAVENDDGGEGGLEPTCGGRVGPRREVGAVEEMDHAEDEDGEGEQRGDDETLCHRAEFGLVGAGGGGGYTDGLEGHAAEGAVTGGGLYDLRMHRAGIVRGGGGWRGGTLGLRAMAAGGHEDYGIVSRVWGQ